jgi:hypothetical protein
MNKKIMVLWLVAIISTSLIFAGTINILKGENDMATITPIEARQSGSVIKTSINTNFSEINEELEDGTTAIGDLTTLETTEKSNLVGAINELNTNKTSSIYGQMISNPINLGSLTLTDANTQYSYTSGLELKYGSGVTYESNALKIATAGKYLVSYNVSVASQSSDSILTIHLMVNNLKLISNNGITINNLGVANTQKSISCSFIEDFSQNDLIKLGFQRGSAPAFTLDGVVCFLTITKL